MPTTTTKDQLLAKFDPDFDPRDVPSEEPPGGRADGAADRNSKTKPLNPDKRILFRFSVASRVRKWPRSPPSAQYLPRKSSGTVSRPTPARPPERQSRLKTPQGFRNTVPNLVMSILFGAGPPMQTRKCPQRPLKTNYSPSSTPIFVHETHPQRSHQEGARTVAPTITRKLSL